MQGTFSTGSSSTFLVLFFVLTITFSLVSAGIFKANTDTCYKQPHEIGDEILEYISDRIW